MPPCKLLVQQDIPEILEENVEGFCEWEQWANKLLGGVGTSRLLSKVFGGQPGPLGDGDGQAGLFANAAGPV